MNIPYVDVGLSFCFDIIFQSELCSIFLQQNIFSRQTQAFASSTNMASSGVTENVILCK